MGLVQQLARRGDRSHGGQLERRPASDEMQMRAQPPGPLAPAPPFGGPERRLPLGPVVVGQARLLDRFHRFFRLGQDLLPVAAHAASPAVGQDVAVFELPEPGFHILRLGGDNRVPARQDLLPLIAFPVDLDKLEQQVDLSLATDLVRPYALR